MNIPFTATTLVKDIVNELPKASDLFKKNRIGFCCDGNVPLNQAAMERSINIDDFMEDLTD